MLDNSLILIGVYSVLEQLFNQTLSVRYFTELIEGSVGNRPVKKAGTLSWLFYHVYLWVII